jgi:hypothetical protein
MGMLVVRVHFDLCLDTRIHPDVDDLALLGEPGIRPAAVVTDADGSLALHVRPGSVLYGFCEVGGLDMLCTSQVGDGSAQLEDPMESPGAHLELFHGRAQEASPSVVYLALLPHLGWSHVGVAG